MTKILLRKGRLVDPYTRTDEILDLLIADGKIAARAPEIAPDDDTLVHDANGLVVAPGLVDIHVHLREPGREDEETILSGAVAAAHGGVTSVAAMPNTEPAIDTASWVEYVLSKDTPIDVHPIAAVTVGRAGRVLTEMAELAQAGAVAFSDDGSPIVDASVMRRALEYASMVGRPIVSHCENPDLVGSGVANEGLAATLAGLPAVPAAAEETMVARDIILARATGARLHIAHVSTRDSVELVRRAKADGLAVTCETAPHYFSLTEDEIRSYDTNVRVNPPLRSADDVAAIKEGLADGTIDAIASDHAPHAREEKEVEFDAAPPGMIGLETLLPVTLTHLVAPGVITLAHAIELTSLGPARVLGVPGGALEIGARADVTVFDPGRAWEVHSDWFLSKSKNSPYVGRTLVGRVVLTIARGEIVFEEKGTTPGGEGNPHENREREPEQLSLSA